MLDEFHRNESVCQDFVMLFPDELSLQVFSFLKDHQILMMCSSLSRDWRRLSTDWTPWKSATLSDFAWLFRNYTLLRRNEFILSHLELDWRKNYHYLTKRTNRTFFNEIAGKRSVLAVTEDGFSVFGGFRDAFAPAFASGFVEFSYPSRVVAASVSWVHGCVVSDTGDLFMIGNPDGEARTAVAFPTPSTKPILKNVLAVSAGVHFTIALDQIGDIWGWGIINNDGGTIESPALITSFSPPLSHTDRFVSVSAGWCQSLCLTRDGYVYSMGAGAALGHGTRLPCRSPMRIRVFLEEFDGDENFDNMPKIAMVSAGFEHSLFLTKGGDVYASGSGSEGRTGFGTVRDALRPVRIPYLGKDSISGRIASISAGGNHSAFLTDSGRIYVCGKLIETKDIDALGNSDCFLPFSSQGGSDLRPQLLSESERFVGVSASAAGYHGVAIKPNGELVLWGGISGMSSLIDSITHLKKPVLPMAFHPRGEFKGPKPRYSISDFIDTD